MSLHSRTSVRRYLAVLVTAFAALFGLSVAPAQAYYDSNSVYQIRPAHAQGMCLEVADWRKDNGAPVRQWPCTGQPNQQWRYVYDTNRSDVYWLKNVWSDKCLEIADWRTDNGAPARQWDCHYGANQTWVANAGSPRLIHPEWSYAANKCLEIADWRTDNGAPARLWDCYYNPNQNWYFDTVS
ncbi:RICIN domain-containing protein [Streptomyces sp. NPDC054794]